MYSDWQAEAKKQIAIAHQQFEPETTWQDRRKYLRSRAWYFHGGTSWGKRVWSKHCRAYLESHGLPKRKPDAPLFAADITFPFAAMSFPLDIANDQPGGQQAQQPEPELSPWGDEK